MIKIALSEIAQIVSGKLVGSEDIEIHGAEFDSRRVTAGQLFCALAGATTHGHAFVSSVAKKGAVAALVEDEQVLKDANIAGVVVKDSLLAMQLLAAWWRSEVGLPVLAITGSVGKTTTKEIAASILGTLGKVTCSQASFNNHVGVPYTLLQISREDRFAVVEIGMNHRGEIAPLSKIVSPDVAVITAIAPAHIGNLGSLRSIAEEKLDISRGLKPGGKLICNSDSELLTDNELLSDLPKNIAKLRYFGRDRSDLSSLALSVVSVNAVSDGIKAIFQLNPTGQEQSIGKEWSSFSCKAPLFGTHHVTNIAAAILGSLTLAPNLELSSVQKAIETFQVPDKRFVRLKAKNGGGEIFDDSYNANPTSMRAFFEATKPFYSCSKNWGVVLGEMRELGDFSADYHREIAKLVGDLRPNFVIAVGADGAKFYEETFKNIPSIAFTKVDTALKAIDAIASHRYEILLVKGARGVQLERFVQVIAE